MTETDKNDEEGTARNLVSAGTIEEKNENNTSKGEAIEPEKVAEGSSSVPGSQRVTFAS